MVVAERNIELNCKWRQTDSSTGGRKPINSLPDRTELTNLSIALDFQKAAQYLRYNEQCWNQTARKCGLWTMDFATGTVSSM